MSPVDHSAWQRIDGRGRIGVEITGVLRNDCPSGIDCDRIYDTDGPDLVIQGRVISDPDALAALGIRPPPPGEAVVLLARSLLPELVGPTEVG